MIKFALALLGILTILPLHSKADEKITIVVLEKYEPYSWLDGDQERGIDVDIVREASNRVGIDVGFVFAPWKRILFWVESGRVDGGTPAFRRPDRERYAFYTAIPLHVSRYYAFTVKDRAFKYKNITSLFGTNVLKLRAYSIGKEFDDASQKADIVVTQIDTIDSALQLLLSKRFDVFVNNDLSTLYRIKQLGLRNRITMNSPAINPGEESFLIFSKAKLGERGKVLVNKFDHALKSMTDDETVQAIIDRYVR